MSSTLHTKKKTRLLNTIVFISVYGIDFQFIRINEI